MARYHVLVLLLSSLALTFLSYLPGLDGPFVFDDQINIVANEALHIKTLDADSIQQAAFSMGSGISARPISMTSFAINYYLTELSTNDFKLVNLFIHLLNTICMFVLTTLILKAHYRHRLDSNMDRTIGWISFTLAAIWAVHPVNLTSVLYVVQRMTSLSALFTLLGLIAYVYGRQHLKIRWHWILSSFVLFTPLAILSKENGALLPIYILLIELFFFHFQTADPAERKPLRWIFIATVGLPLLLIGLYTLYNSAWLMGGYSIRDFSLTERLMTEARILWFYLRLIFAPSITELGLYHDDIAVSRGLFDPWTTILSISGLMALVVFAIACTRKYPIAGFGILFYLLGHSIESSVIALELAHEHRNYLPMYGLLLIATFYIFSPSSTFLTQKYKPVVAVAFILLFAGVTHVRSTQWGDFYSLHHMEVMHHPNSLRANTDMAYVYAFFPAFSAAEADENFILAIKHYQKAYELSNTDASGLLGLVGLSAQRNKPIQESWLDDLEHRLSSFPFSPSYANSLMSLEKCVTRGTCNNFHPLLMDKLLQAALKNPTLYGKARSNLLFSRSNLLITRLDKHNEARESAILAAELLPQSIAAQITLLKFLVKLNDIEKANQLLRTLKEQRNGDVYESDLNEIEAILANRHNL